MSSRSSGDTSTMHARTGACGSAAAIRYTVRVATAVTISTVCCKPAGTQTARRGGTTSRRQCARAYAARRRRRALRAVRHPHAGRRGIATFPDGTRVAWFKDPDDDVLSVAQLR
jgi:hypothetical protein